MVGGADEESPGFRLAPSAGLLAVDSSASLPVTLHHQRFADMPAKTVFGQPVPRFFTGMHLDDRQFDAVEDALVFGHTGEVAVCFVDTHHGLRTVRGGPCQKRMRGGKAALGAALPQVQVHHVRPARGLTRCFPGLLDALHHDAYTLMIEAAFQDCKADLIVPTDGTGTVRTVGHGMHAWAVPTLGI